MSVRHVGRENVVKRLQPRQGAAGATVYSDGKACFETAEETILVRPPFGLGHEARYEYVETGPLLVALAQDRLVGVLLVRLGGYAVGVLDGERLVASKVGQRLVHGRHRAGGSSANRFRRRREEQASALVRSAASEAVRVLEPYLDRLDAAALGGDRFAVRAVLESRSELASFEAIAIPRFFTTPDPRRRVLERFGYDLYAAELTSGATLAS